MRDPMSWSVPLFRAFGIPVKVHITFFVITLGFFFREVLRQNAYIAWYDVFLFSVVMLFGVVLLHEFGHCFGGRSVGGEAREILIWPLGGLAFVETPQHPKAHLITVAAGPAVNLFFCIVTGIGLATAGFLPNANPLANPYTAEMKNYRDGRTYTSQYGVRLYKPGTAEEVISPTIPLFLLPAEFAAKLPSNIEVAEEFQKSNGFERALASPALVWTQRLFWLNFMLLIFNLFPAFPLDGGQLLQGFIWSRSGSYRQGIAVAAYAGFITAMLFLVAAFVFNELVLGFIALFLYVNCQQRMHGLEADEGVFGYDFSAGYTSLERDDPPPPPQKKVGPLKRWLQARKARKIAAEAEERVRDEERMDGLLDKINKQGRQSLTDEERRFMERVSARYRNRS
jgi:Zn-dependent protease